MRAGLVLELEATTEEELRKFRSAGTGAGERKQEGSDLSNSKVDDPTGANLAPVKKNFCATGERCFGWSDLSSLN